MPPGYSHPEMSSRLGTCKVLGMDGSHEVIVRGLCRNATCHVLRTNEMGTTLLTCGVFCKRSV